MILNCWLEMVVERVVYRVRARCLASRGPSLKSRRLVGYELDVTYETFQQHVREGPEKLVETVALLSAVPSAGVQ